MWASGCNSVSAKGIESGPGAKWQGRRALNTIVLDSVRPPEAPKSDSEADKWFKEWEVEAETSVLCYKGIYIYTSIYKIL